jgi:hypothetical protein
VYVYAQTAVSAAMCTHGHGDLAMPSLFIYIYVCVFTVHTEYLC